MAHLTTEETWDVDGTGEANPGLKRTWERKFIVIFDDVVHPPEALDATGVPRRWEPHPYDSTMLAKKGHAVHRGDSPFIWTVSITYESLTDEEERGEDDPRDRPPEIETDFISFQTPMLYDYNGRAVLNSALDPFGSPWMMEDSRPVVRITRFETDFDFARSLAYRNAVNIDTFFGMAAGEVMCMYIKQKRHFENTIECWHTAYEFQGKANGEVMSAGTLTTYNGWDAVIPDVGFNEIIDGEKQLIKDESSPPRPVSREVRLDGNGVSLASDADIDQTYFHVYRPPYRYLAFSALNLPEPP